ncbi:hypothetical protein MUP77_04010 [Candidatus Bathyarchaeota archaeon]|nr:hypothetical protein [Candidatus Bathyarchaeota archaeon]
MKVIRRIQIPIKLKEDKGYLFLAFVVGTLIRSVPNLVTQYPIGFDTLSYVTQLMDWRRILSNPNIIFQTPLHLLIVSPIYVATGLDPFTILRIAQPLLYGLVAASSYYAAGKLLHWEPRQALLAAIILSLQTVTLRISWDLFRNVLGLAILLFTLPKLKNHEKEPLTFAILSTLTVLSHQMTAVLLMFIITFLAFDHTRKREYTQARKLIIHSLPSLLLFTGMIAYSSGILSFSAPRIPSIFQNIVSMPYNRSSPSPFFFNYLAGDGLVDYGQSYLYLLQDVIYLYAASFLLILPLVILGFRGLREKTLDLWSGFCAIGSFMCLLTPSFALLYWDRWMQLLVVPYAFYATNGLIRVSNMIRFRKHRTKLITSACAIYAIVAVLYMAMPYSNPISPYAALWNSSKYSPTTMLTNTVPVEDVPDVGRAFQWLNQNMENHSCLLTREAFVDWAKHYLSKDSTIVYYLNKPVTEGLQYAKTLNYINIYWIWWEENGIGIKWYGQSVPNEFKPVYQTGNIVVYKYSDF